MSATKQSTEDRKFRGKVTWAVRKFRAEHGREPDADERQVIEDEIRAELQDAPVEPETNEMDDLKDFLSDVMAGAKAKKEDAVEAAPQEEKLIHFLEDGFTGGLGSIFYRGQELRIKTGTPEWTATVDPGTGESWVDMSEEDQFDRYGKVMFRKGPWTGLSMDQAKKLWDEAAGIVDDSERKRAEKKLIREGIVAPPAVGAGPSNAIRR